MNAAQRIEKAMRRVEEASAELLQAAAKYGNQDPTSWDNAKNARDVHAYARAYANAMRGLQRANRSA